MRKGLALVRPGTLPLQQAVGAVLAADVVVAADLPAKPIAYADGWAVHSSNLVGASTYGTAVLERPPPWVDAGDVMPEGDAVLAPDDLTIGAHGEAEASAAVAPGQGVRLIGQDATAGTVVAKQGTRLGVHQIGALQACGIEAVLVRVPRVRIVVASGAAKLHAPMLRAWLAGAGAEVIDVADGSESAQDLSALYGKPDADLVVSVGGTGQGRHDRAVAALAAAGSIDVHGIALRPGAGAGFGRAGSIRILLLPGRFDGMLAGFLALGLPALASLSGLDEERPYASLPLGERVTSTVGLGEVFLAARLGERLQAAPLSEARLDIVAGAAGWFLVPAQLEGLAAGHIVRWQPF